MKNWFKSKKMKIAQLDSALNMCKDDIEYNRARHANIIGRLADRMQMIETQLNVLTSSLDVQFVEVKKHWEIQTVKQNDDS